MTFGIIWVWGYVLYQLAQNKFLYPNQTETVQNTPSANTKIAKRKENKTMARKRVVSRTIKATQVTVRIINTETEEIDNAVFTLSTVWKDSEKALKKIKKEHETETEKIISVVGMETIEEKRYMSEEDFIRLSVPYADDVDAEEV